MKGYLQRLLRTVTNPAESVHPWTASVFAAGYQSDFHVVQSEELAPFAAAIQSHGTVSPDSAQSSQTSAPTQSSPLGAEGKSLTSELRTTESALGSTEAEQSAYRGPSFSKKMIPEPLIASAEGSAQYSVEATELEMAPAKGSARALTPSGHGPLISAEAVIKFGNAVELGAGSSPAPAGKKDARAVRDSVTVDRQTDEIQIHIGRIEVTAIRPPPPRAPKGRDKEISLDAYLKRRDGRTG